VIVIKKIFNLFFVCLLLISVGWLNVSDSFYLHSHIIDGKIVHHSHPYSKSNSHNHSKDEFVFIKIIEKVLKVFLFIVALLNLNRYLSLEFSFFPEKVKICFTYLAKSHPIRAPSF